MAQPAMKPSGLDEWRQGASTGASSKAIADYLTGAGEERFWSYPLDAYDFDRCENLLSSVPELRAPFVSKMPAANQYWAALVPQWEAIKAANDKTAAIKAIIRPLEKADPSFVRVSDSASLRVGGAEANNYGAPSLGSPHMKNTDADRAVADTAYRVTADELRSFVERFERLEMEKKDLADQQKEVMAEAKGRGYDTKAIRKVIAMRKKSADQLAEEKAVVELYREVLGMR